ncbi:MAG: bifunctional 2-C-methyl-D-erythritol 4-phosphate cytidylyltransferase/2-C-methyl-D-erythritol 2,4-cyclodiphosphate synthase [Sphingomonadaceae bacterium]|nr:bifunctional 2-C-methyl-D-erythritol 4-phosphate cytidylyltransferase/2-C-methyl-D-erythritol 2,4-cyclodiphosphate synthase [Sphingomonadaceae bacterium]
MPETSLRTVAIVVAGGTGSRAGSAVPKQYASLGGNAVLAHAIASLARHPAIAAVQPVIGQEQSELYRGHIKVDALAPVVGGAVRQASVLAGLEAIAAAGGADRVLIHDAARPFVPGAVVDRLLAALDGDDGAVPVLPVVDSLARDAGLLGDPAPRDGLMRVQTPQAFRFGAILAAHRAAAGGNAGDDAQLAREAGLRVAMVAGDEMLAKVTHPEDFAAAERRLAARMIARTAMGFDVHAFDAGDHVMVCGVRVPHAKALAGHSDADVGLHAITDALLGAIGDGDIGSHFPPSDPQWKGADSAAFIAHARDLVAARGGIIDHVDVTIVCEAPKIGPHREAMRARIAELLRLPLRRTSVKATTTERLGFTGRSEGMAAQAVATIRLPEDM